MKHSTQIIGLAGRKGSGKNTIADVIYNELLTLDYSCKIYALADPLKQVCIDILGLDPKLVYGSDEDKNTETEYTKKDFANSIQKKYLMGDEFSQPATIRYILQKMGTEFFRSIDQDIWIKTLFRRIAKDQPDFAIISDIRFPNECDKFLQKNAKLIKLTRSIDSSDKHISETSLDDFHKFTFIIDNQNMSLKEQDTHIRKLIHTIL
jgi:hypothetical protein